MSDPAHTIKHMNTQYTGFTGLHGTQGSQEERKIENGGLRATKHSNTRVSVIDRETDMSMVCVH